MIIKLDGNEYDLFVTGLNINGEFLYKYAERVESGEFKSEAIGFFENQTLSIKGDNDLSFVEFYEYLSTLKSDGTYNVLTEVFSPVGTYEFLMYPNRLNINLKTIDKSGSNWWATMDITFTAVNKKV